MREAAGLDGPNASSVGLTRAEAVVIFSFYDMNVPMSHSIKTSALSLTLTGRYETSEGPSSSDFVEVLSGRYLVYLLGHQERAPRVSGWRPLRIYLYWN